MYESIHEQEKKNFDLQLWKQRFANAKAHRAGLWESIAERCIRIRENRIPENKTLPNYDDYQGKFYKDNLIFKHIKYLVSTLSGSIVTFDLESKTSIRDENTEILEQELNMLSAQQDLAYISQPALYDCFYTGMGYMKRYWDTLDIDVANETGKEKFEYVNWRKMYIDEATQQPDKSDMRYIFHLEKYDWLEMAQEYPHLREKFKYKKDVNGQIEVVLVQYRTMKVIESVTIKDTGREIPKSWIMPLEEWKKHIESGADVPEGVIVSKPFKRRVPMWYEAKFFVDLEEVIEQPVYVGEMCQYHIMAYAPFEDSAYSVGIAYYLMDMQDIKTIVTTVLALITMRYQKNEKEIVNGALDNMDEYLQNGYKLGVNPIVNEQWKKDNPNEDAVKVKDLPQFPQGLTLLSQMVDESMKTTSGVTDALAGQSIGSNTSGVYLAQLQSAGKVYHKEETYKYEHFLTQIGTGMMYDISEFRDYPHTVQHLDEDNQQKLVMVNDPEVNDLTFEPERTTVSCSITENAELIKQLEQELALALFDRGIMAGRTVLEYTPFNNPDRIYDEAQKEKGLLEIQQFLSSNPQAMEIVQQLMQQGQGV